MQNWLTFGELPPEMRDPFTYALIVMAWVGFIIGGSVILVQLLS